MSISAGDAALEALWTDAVSRRRALRRRQPGHVGALNHLGAALVRLGQVDDRLAALEASVTAAPQIAGFARNLAAADETLERWDAAEKTYRAAIALDPKDPSLPLRLEIALLGRGAAEAAIAPLRQAATAAPMESRPLDLLARACFEAGRLAEAPRTGARALLVKDRRSRARAAPATFRPGPPPPPPPSSAETRTQNLITFSLWGPALRYVGGALETARRARVSFPDWTQVFFCDADTPVDARAVLAAEGAQVMLMDAAPGGAHRLI